MQINPSTRTTSSTLPQMADTQDVIKRLNDLIETCKDGEYGFRTCAEQAKSPQLKNLLTTRADGCAQAAQELQRCVLDLGGKPDTSGSLAGAMHRGWVAVRSALSTMNDHAVLDECERGEDVALKAYREALASDLPPDIREIVERQAQGAQRNHDQVKAMRDSLPH